MQQTALRISGALEQAWIRSRARLPQWRRDDWRARKLQWRMLMLQARAARLPRSDIASLLRWDLPGWQMPNWRQHAGAAGIAAIAAVTVGAFGLAAFVPGPPLEQPSPDFTAIADNGRDGLVASACNTSAGACTGVPAQTTRTPESSPAPVEAEPDPVVAKPEPEQQVRVAAIAVPPAVERDRPPRVTKARAPQRRYQPAPAGIGPSLDRAMRQAARDFNRVFR